MSFGDGVISAYRLPVECFSVSYVKLQDLEEYHKLIERKARGEIIEADIPENLKPLLQEPVAHGKTSTPIKSPPVKSPVQSPVSEEGSHIPGFLSKNLGLKTFHFTNSELLRK